MDIIQKENISIYFCGEEACSAGHFYGPAVRPHYLIHVVLSGKGIFRRKGITYYLKEGDAFLISPLESTYYEADNLSPWHYMWVGFDGFLVEHLLENTCFSHSCVYECANLSKQIHKITQQIRSLIYTFQSPEHNKLTLLGYLYLLFGMMEGKEEEGKEPYSTLYFQKALDYIKNNYSYPIKITEIASSIGIDRTYLYRLFLEKEGISPKQYLHQLRLRTAARLLSSSDYTITEISYFCGFKDSSAFCNQFKKAFNLTPGKYRGGELFELVVKDNSTRKKQ